LCIRFNPNYVALGATGCTIGPYTFSDIEYSVSASGGASVPTVWVLRNPQIVQAVEIRSAVGVGEESACGPRKARSALGERAVPIKHETPYRSSRVGFLLSAANASYKLGCAIARRQLSRTFTSKSILALLLGSILRDTGQ
jgi:hypothetical protein